MLKKGGWQLGDDIAGQYIKYCEDVCKNLEMLMHFRRPLIYRRIVEGASKQTGVDNIAHIRDAFGERVLVRNLDKARLNDKFGDPIKYDYGKYGKFAPTTLRYLKVAFDLIKYFGVQPGWDIFEVGPGYGGLCSLIYRMFTPKSYTMVDLQWPSRLAAKYLLLFGIDRYKLNQNYYADKYDLFLSTFAFSELGKEVQSKYLKGVIPKSTRGYLLYNATPGSYTCQEILERIKGSRAYPEGVAASRSQIIVWGAK